MKSLGMGFLLALFLSFQAHAERAFPLTHNLTALGHFLAKKQCTVGLQIAACGLSERWTVGTSPWLIADYDMLVLSSRSRLKKYADGGSLSLQANYFKTMHNDHFTYSYPYRMEALWLMWVRTLPLAPHYTLHLNLHTNYYHDDTMPFSLRRPIPNRNAGQINVSSLHEIHLLKGFYSLIEIGLVDLAQPYNSPYLHMGASLGWSDKRWEIHVGYSVTGTMTAFHAPDRTDYQQRLRYTRLGYQQNLTKYEANRDFSIHPEFSLQYFF